MFSWGLAPEGLLEFGLDARFEDGAAAAEPVCLLRREDRLAQVDEVEVGPFDERVAQVGAAEVGRPDLLGRAEGLVVVLVGVEAVARPFRRPSEDQAAPRRAHVEARLPEIGVAEVRLLPLHVAQLRAVEARPAERGASLVDFGS